MSGSPARRRPPAGRAVRIARWLAAVMGLVAVSCLVTGLLLLPVADHSSSDSSPAVLAVVLLVTIAALAGVICAVLLLGLAVRRAVARLRRARRPAGTAPGGGDSAAGARLSRPAEPGGPAPR